MKERVKGSHNDRPNNNTAKVGDSKDITKVLAYFRYKVATTLDAALDLGMLRNSITWYVRDLEAMGCCKLSASDLMQQLDIRLIIILQIRVCGCASLSN